ncbi:hypothetical protein LIA77_07838 [Sarocladium implicatum]|nr:hypothetical protein LIA77_07838 [Sarocladium implicatum]
MRLCTGGEGTAFADTQPVLEVSDTFRESDALRIQTLTGTVDQPQPERPHEKNEASDERTVVIGEGDEPRATHGRSVKKATVDRDALEVTAPITKKELLGDVFSESSVLTMRLSTVCRRQYTCSSLGHLANH